MKTEPANTNYCMNLKTGSFFEFSSETGELKIKQTDNIYYLKRKNNSAHKPGRF